MTSRSPGPVRISFLITELDQGGAERALVRLVTGLDRARWTPSVICLSERGPLAEPLEAAGVPVTCLGVRPSYCPRAWWRASIGLVLELRRQKPELLQTFLFHANLAGRVAAWLAGVRVVVAGIRVAERRSRWRLLADRWTRWLVTRHVCVSESVAAFSCARSKLSRATVVVIPNGVDVDHFRNGPPAALTELGVPNGARTVLSVGRLDAQKAPLQLLEAFAAIAPQHPAAHLLFVGHGPLESALRDDIQRRKLGDRVHVAGWRPDVAALMRAAEVFVLASRWEGMPNVILEAGAAGLPVISTRVEGVEEIVTDDETALLVPVDDAARLADALNDVLTQPDRPTARAKQLQLEIVERFSWESVVERYDLLYQSLLH